MAQQSLKISQISFVEEARAIVDPDPDWYSGYRLKNDQIAVFIAVDVAAAQLNLGTRAKKTERSIL
jgi:hypothetical protein